MRKVLLCLVLLALVTQACGTGATGSPSTQPTIRTVPTEPSGAETTSTTSKPTEAPTPSIPAPSPDPTAASATTPTHTPSPVAQIEPGTRLLEIGGLTASQLIGDPQLGDNFYALTPAGLYITRDGGLSWAQVTSEPLQEDFVFSPLEPGILYAGAGADCYRGGPDQPLYKSINGGATWSELANGVNLRPAAVHPSDPSQIWAIGCVGPAFSPDAGESWMTSDDDLFLLYDASQLVPQADNWSVVFVSGVSEGGSGVVARSRDGGATWTPLLQESPERPLWWINDLLVLPPVTETGANQLFLVDPHGVWHSRDGGETWDFSDAGLDDVIYRDGADFATIGLNAMAVDATAEPPIIYLGTAQGVYTSSNGGETWTRLQNDLWDNASILDLAISPASPTDKAARPTQRLFVTTAGGVYIFVP